MTDHAATAELTRAVTRLRELRPVISEDLHHLKVVLAALDTKDKKITALSERVRECSGIIKLLYRDKHPKQVEICNGVLDKNTAALQLP